MRLAHCLLMVTLALPVASVHADSGTLYKWVDANGNVHYSDEVPADAAKGERDVLRNNGQVKQVLPRQQTPEELATEKQKELEAQQQADYDKSLLKTYATLAELKRAGVDRLASFDARIVQDEKLVNDAEVTLDDLRARQASAQAGGQPVDPDLERQIGTYESAQAENRAALTQVRQERQHAEEQYFRDVERYTQLQGHSAAPKPGG